jgi:hypothetical protein
MRGYYQAEVGCSVTRESDGVNVGYAWVADNGGFQGYAQAVVVFQGSLEENYTVTANHSADIAYFQDPEEPQSEPELTLGVTYGWMDYYNFDYFSASPIQTYPGWWSWSNWGPFHYRAAAGILLGNTFMKWAQFTAECRTTNQSPYLGSCTYTCTATGYPPEVSVISLNSIKRACPPPRETCPSYLKVAVTAWDAWGTGIGLNRVIPNSCDYTSIH